MASRPPPPEPYETWLDWVVVYDSNGYAKAELAELRAELERMKRKLCGDFTTDPRPGILETLEAIRAAGGKAWDDVDDVVAALGRDNTPDPADEYLRTARAAIDAAKST